ncbi:hypothetical protein [Ruegeria sp.]|uniref:hypothetical protein n=1 Tax=Ruegeria sp. TaxID=1879320 RepID=UPI003B596F66
MKKGASELDQFAVRFAHVSDLGSFNDPSGAIKVDVFADAQNSADGSRFPGKQPFRQLLGFCSSG